MLPNITSSMNRSGISGQSQIGFDVQVHPPAEDAGQAPSHSSCTQMQTPPCSDTATIGTGSFFHGASDFGVKHLKVVTITNNFSSTTGAKDGQERQSISLEASHTTTHSSGNSSSEFTATLNTPYQQLRFEYRQREIDLSLREEQIRLQEANAELKREYANLAQWEAALARREAAIFDKERAIIEEGTARADLITIFGVEESKGLNHILRDFTIFKKEPGERMGRLLQLRTRFLPHYAGLPKDDICKRHLCNTFGVGIASVVKDLHADHQSSDRPLAFESIRAKLSQLMFLTHQPGHDTVSHRAIKICEGDPLPRFLFQSQWIIKLVDADKPESVLDSEIATPGSKHPKWEMKSKFYPEDRDRSGDQGPIDLLDLTVLTFPCVNIPRFKLSRLLLKCTIPKTESLLTKKKWGIDIEYQMLLYNLRGDTEDGISPEARNRRAAYAYGLYTLVKRECWLWRAHDAKQSYLQIQ